MKKTLLSALLITCFGLFTFAQSFEMYYEGEMVPNEGTIVLTGEQSAIELVGELALKNISSSALEVKVKKYDVSLIAGTSTMFCWDLCFPPNVYLSPNFITIEADETVDKFSTHYQPQNNSGVSLGMYTFFDQNNVNDSVCFHVEYNAGTVGLNEFGVEQITVSNPYPNPALSQVSFDYNLPLNTNGAVINVHNLLGAVVKSTRINPGSGTMILDVNDLNDGVYFYSVNINNQIIETKRLIVSR